MQKILVFGGTFNPIHLGHVRLYRHFARLLHVDKCLIIPDNLPPHKEPDELAGGDDRMELCRLAVKDDPTAEVCDMELLRGGESYTDVTLEQIKKQYADARLYFVVGSDMFFTLDKWRDTQKIMDLAAICTAARHPNELSLLSQKAEEYKKTYGGEYIIEGVKVLEISSTKLRQMIKDGAKLSEYLPPAVENYIKMNGLYKA